MLDSQPDCYNCADNNWRMSKMFVCPDCGNKRCPKATDHTYSCSGSNEPGQPGSRYGKFPENEKYGCVDCGSINHTTGDINWCLVAQERQEDVRP